MAEKGDKDVKRKGQELWKALKKDPLDRKTIQELLETRAPTNFREPGIQEVFVNLLPFCLFWNKENSALCSADPDIC